MKIAIIGPHGCYKAKMLHTLLNKAWPEDGITPLIENATYQNLIINETSGKNEG